MNVFTYWAGLKPAWIDVCLKSIERCCTGDTKFHLLTPETIANGMDDVNASVRQLLPKRWLDLPPGVGTDCLRALLLFRFGGLWIDADSICLTNPANLIKNRHRGDQFLYSRWPAKPDRVIAGYVYSPQHHPIVTQWYGVVCNALENAENIGWGDLGEKILTQLVNMSPSPKSSFQMAIETFMPIDIDSNVQRYFQQSGWRDFVTQDTIAFGLNYSWMMHNKRDVLEPFPKDYMFLRDTFPMILRLLEDTDNVNRQRERISRRAK